MTATGPASLPPKPDAGSDDGPDLRDELAAVGADVARAGLVVGSGGNLSARLPGADTCWVTAAGTWLDRLDRSSFVRVRISDGAVLPESGWPADEPTNGSPRSTSGPIAGTLPPGGVPFEGGVPQDSVPHGGGQSEGRGPHGGVPFEGGGPHNGGLVEGRGPHDSGPFEGGGPRDGSGPLEGGGPYDGGGPREAGSLQSGVPLDDGVPVDGGVPEVGRARAASHPSSEVALHIATYRARPDVSAVIHLHPQMVLLLDALGERVRLVTTDHAFYVRRVAVVPFIPPGTDELATAAAAAVADGTNCLVLRRHGCSVLADSVTLAHKRVRNLEEAAALTYRALAAGRLADLTDQPPPDKA